MFKYLETLPTSLTILIVVVFLVCFLITTVAITYVLVHRKFKIKFGEKEIEVEEAKPEDVKVEPPKEVTADVKN